MKIKWILFLFVIFLLPAAFGLLSACGPKKEAPGSTSGSSTAETTATNTSVATGPDAGSLPFWTVTDPTTGAKIYLLGSIHAAREGLYPMPKAVEDAYAASPYLVVEANIITAEKDMALLVRCMEKMIYSDGTTISSHIAPEIYNDAKALLTREGMYNITLDYMMPVLWATMLQSLWVEKSTLLSDLGVDRHYLSRAMADGKTIVEIESAEAQYAMLASFSPALQEMFLRSSMEDPALQVSELEELYNIWLTGDLEQIDNFSSSNDEELTEEEKLLLEEYNQKLLYDRNLPMAKRAEAFLKEQKTCLFIVGAAHMAGETGIVAYLTEKGYEVTK